MSSIKVEVTNSAGVVTDRTIFSSNEELQAWLADVKPSWGKPERWVRADSGEDVTAALAQRTVEDIPATKDSNGKTVPAVTHIEYKLPAQYTAVITDITQQVEDTQRVESGVQSQYAGSRVRALVWAINDAKQATPEQLMAMLSDPTIAIAERLLLNGALQTAKVVIGQIDEKFFTAAEKARVIALIDAGG